ncbi:MAG: MFS transporter [Bacteroidetes bacterium]|nr:MFS transporter [Bacteroidota bacterium]
MEKKKIFTRTIITLSLVSLFNDISSEMLIPVMPVYLTSIGFSALWIGVLEGFAEAVVGLSKGYFGKLSDTTGKRIPFIRVGYFLSALSKPVIGLFTNAIWIFSARTGDRLGKGIRTSARDALLADESLPEHRGKVFGLHRAADTIGAAIGPALAVMYLGFFPGHYRQLFLYAFFPAMIGVMLTFFLKQHNVFSKKKSGGSGFFSYFSYWKTSSPSYRKISFGLLLFALFNSSDVFLIMMAKHQGLSDQMVITAYIFYNLVYAAFSFPAGSLADKFGMKKMLMTGLIFYIITYALFPTAHSIPFIFLLFFMYGLYAASNEGIAKAWITTLCSPGDKATAIGFYSSAVSICTLLASTFTGFIWTKFSADAALWISAGGVFSVFLYFYAIGRKII